jgi:membrane-associated protease RseP (regulator of RpoE activity)
VSATRRQPSRETPVWVHVLLLVATFLTMSVVGASVNFTYLTDFLQQPLPAGTGRADIWRGGLWYSAGAIAILGSHELGHYVACRYYGIRASLPFFLPGPPGLSLLGTFGAVIRVREPIRTKRQLFDIGIAGPIAGFVVAVPALVLGILWSHVIPEPAPLPGTVNLGEPLLFSTLASLVHGSIPEHSTLNMHPLVLAAWLGLLATALNLLPIGQLDGGHITYAVIGRPAAFVSVLALGVGLALGFLYSSSWFFWVGLLLLLLVLSGFRHPPTVDEHQPLDRTRLILAGVAAAILVLCFTPTPISPTELVGAAR